MILVFAGNALPQLIYIPIASLSVSLTVINADPWVYEMPFSTISQFLIDKDANFVAYLKISKDFVLFFVI